MDVQIFGIRKSSETRAALRFFAERRIRTHFVDLTQREPGPRELGRFAQKFGVDAILDRDSRRFHDLGLASAHLSDARWLDRLIEEPLMLRMPLVRAGNRLSVGAAEEDWKRWIEESGG
jgi:arsenate reductase (glutaredoxin)